MPKATAEQDEPDGSAPTAPTVSASPAATSPDAARAWDTREHRLADSLLRLHSDARSCILTVVRTASADTNAGGQLATTTRLNLDLKPPCYLLVWNSPPPRLAGGRSESGGTPIGGVGDPLAWKYGDRPGVTVVAVVGDEVSEALRAGALYQTRQSQNFHCGGSLQGVKLSAREAELGPKRTQSAVYCLETGLDEKDFWMLAHD